MLRLFTLLALLSMTPLSTGQPQVGKILVPCPDSPNCVCSQATDDNHHIEALQFSGGADTAIQQLIQVLKNSESITITETSEYAIRAQAHSGFFGFIDDIQFVVWPPQKLIHVRSASRSGYWDLGVNRKRVERIFQALSLALSTQDS